MISVRRFWEPRFKYIKPNVLIDFKNVSNEDAICLPELVNKRSITNSISFSLFVVVCGLICYYTIYTLWYVDIRRLTKGQDSCGNICGIKNRKVPFKTCFALDHTHYEVALLYGPEQSYPFCVPKNACDLNNNELILQRCFPKTDSKQIEPYDVRSTTQMLYMRIETVLNNKIGFIVMIFSAVALNLCFFGFSMLNIQKTFFAFSALFIFFITMFAISLCLWTVMQERGLIWVAVLYTIGAIVVVVNIGRMFVLRKEHFNIVLRLYLEAMTVIVKLPMLFMVPILSSIFLFIFIGILLYSILIFYTVNEIDDSSWKNIVYSSVFGVFTFYMYVFTTACQAIVVGGAVSLYYFAPDKSAISRPVAKGLWILFRYHLGSAAMGSLLIPTATVFRRLSRFIREKCFANKKRLLARCCSWSVQWLHNLPGAEESSYYSSRKAYIMIALHGHGFRISGKRGAKLYWLFLLDTMLIDEDVSTLMHTFSASFMLTSAALGAVVLLCKSSEVFFVPIVIGTCLAGTITYFYALIIIVCGQTLLLCFCEDMLFNDGSKEHPHLTNPGLTKVVIDGILHGKKRKDKLECNTTMEESASKVAIYYKHLPLLQAEV